jgi:hypothetical protein
MEKRKLDNGLLLILYLSNILAPLGFGVYFGISYLENPEENDYIFPLLIFAFTFISFLLFFRFRKVEFDEQNVYVKNVFNSEIDSFPIRNIKSVKKMFLTFNSKGTRGKSGKNYKISYLNNNGIEKKVRVMATIDNDVENDFKRLTSFLGTEGFNPE